MPPRSALIHYTTMVADLRTDAQILRRNKPKSPDRDKIISDLLAAAIAYDRLVAMEEGRS